MKSPMVSVIIPTYNRAQYISDAVRSVLAQTYRDFELIVVDDGSIDNTKEILRPYLKSLKYIYQGNSGISVARNVGIKNSSGEYIAFLDSDDLWLRDKLRLQMHFLQTQPQVAMAYADYCTFKNSHTSSNLCHHVRAIPSKNRQYGDVFVDLLMNCHISTVTVILRKHVIDDVGLFDPSLTTGEDYDLWLRIAARYPVGYLPKIVSLVRSHDTNVTSTRFLSEPPGEIKAIEKSLRIFPYKIVTLPPYRLQERLSRIYFSTGLAAFSAGRYSVARFHFRKAVMIGPFTLKFLLYLAASLILPGLVSRFIKYVKKDLDCTKLEDRQCCPSERLRMRL